MLIKLYTLILTIILTSAVQAQGDFFQASLGDYQEELEIAANENKKAIMIFFQMDECPFCHWMKSNVLNQSKVQTYYKKNFHLLSHDIEGDVEITDFDGNTITQKDFASKKHRVRATPVIAFFDLKGKKITKFTGRTSSVEEFLLLGKYVETQAYKQMRFSKYKRVNQ
ncbi:MAG: thioredoxin fold domain-containing protein [Gammaproteobacteria bacterium]|nr:thioredoxin fold domain-containing protein [Gammaproteobacteria bacterium]